MKRFSKRYENEKRKLGIYFRTLAILYKKFEPNEWGEKLYIISQIKLQA